MTHTKGGGHLIPCTDTQEIGDMVHQLRRSGQEDFKISMMVCENPPYKKSSCRAAHGRFVWGSFYTLLVLSIMARDSAHLEGGIRASGEQTSR